jgi:ABC-2 type transport system permease protein
VAWSALVASILLGPLFGATLGVPAVARDLSPFTHVPKVPAGPFDAGPIVALLAVLVAFAAVGLAGLRRRDLRLPA